MPIPRVASIAVCLVGVLNLPSDGVAQTARPERPYRGLFGNGGADARETLILNTSIGGGYDDNLLLDQPGGSAGDPRIAKSGGLGLFNASLAYNNNKDRGSIGAMAGASTRYYPTQDEDPYVGAYGAAVGGSYRYGTRSTLSVNQSVSYQPYTFATLFPLLIEPLPGQFPDQALDLATGKQEYLSLYSNARLSHAMSRRTTFVANYGFNVSETAFTVLDAIDPGDMLFSGHNAYAGITYALSRDASMRAGYGYTDGSFSNSTTRGRTHNIDVGIDYRKALSFSRRTTFSFSTGTAALTNGDRTNFQFIGSANLAHEIGRSWLANVAYDRSFNFVDTLLLPVFQDSLSASIGGLISRRVDFQSGVRAIVGTFGYDVSRASNTFDTFQAYAGISYAVTRFMQVGTNYSFYRYRFDDFAPLPLAVPRNVDRQSVRAQLNFWLPLMTRRR
jgi:opacity protein-like surface antigen